MKWKMQQCMIFSNTKIFMKTWITGNLDYQIVLNSLLK